jgi:hypothetical protein
VSGMGILVILILIILASGPMTTLGSPLTSVEGFFFSLALECFLVSASYDNINMMIQWMLCYDGTS